MIFEEQKTQTANLNAVNEAMSVYIHKIKESTQVEVNLEDMNYSDFFNNKMLIIKAIRKGFPFKLFSKIKEITPFSDDDWAEYLNLSKKTLHRYRNDTNFFFKPIHTEKIIELAEVTNFGKEVFDTTEQFYLWLNTPSLALGNLKPAELLKDSYGKEMVMSELNRIEHGIFA